MNTTNGKTCSCGYSLAAPGVGYWSQNGWICKKCEEVHTTATPPEPPEITQNELFGKMAAALFCLSTAPADWQIPQEARETYKKLALQAFPLAS